MKRSYKIIRAILMTVIAMLVAIPATIYVVMALPQVQEKVCDVGEEELSKLLNSHVEIGSVTFTPFNKVTLRNIVINDAKGDTAVFIKRLGAGIDLNELIAKHNIVITYTELIGLDARIYKDSINAPYNIQPIIEALKPKDKNKPPTRFDLKVNTVIIRNSQLAYDINSESHDIDGFDKNHIYINNFNVDARLPQIKNDNFKIDIKRFAFNEQSGFEISSFSGNFHISATGSSANNVVLKMPNSEIYLSDIILEYGNWNELRQNINNVPINLSITSNSHITPSDFSGFVPKLKDFNEHLNIELLTKATLNDITISKLNISTEDNRIKITGQGGINNFNKNNITFNFPQININGNGKEFVEIISSINPISPKARQTLINLEKISLSLNTKGTPKNALVKGVLSSSAGGANIGIKYNQITTNSPINLSGNLNITDLNLGKIINNPILGNINTKADFDATIHKKSIKGTINTSIEEFEFKDYAYHDINAIIDVNNNHYNGSIIINDPNANIIIAGEATIENKIPNIDVHIDAKNIAFDKLNIWNKYPDYKLSSSIHAAYNGKNFDNAVASLNINGLTFVAPEQKAIELERMSIDIDNLSEIQYINVNSDIIDGTIEGTYSSSTLLTSIKDIISHAFPTIVKEECHNEIATDTKNIETPRQNNFAYNFTIKDNNTLTDFINSPVKLIHPIYISGKINHPEHLMDLKIDIPYLQQKNKLIKNSSLIIDVDSNNDKCQLYITTLFPTKKGDCEFILDCNGKNNRLDTEVLWNIQQKRRFDGEILLSTLFHRDDENMLTTDIDINPSKLIFNDTAWTVNPAHIKIANNEIDVNGFDVYRDNQYIKLSGRASANEDDQLCLQLLDVNLDYIFETLAINNVMFGGNATGTFYASSLFSKEPKMHTPGLKVHNLSYNYAVLGNAIIKSHWDNARRAVNIDADIDQSNGRKSFIDGDIFPLEERLDIKFNTDKVNVGFMQPFMAAFAKDVSGYASGNAHLYGTFKLIDMTGDIYAEDLKLKIDFTNTYYTATDSIHLKPGLIEFENVELSDIYGNKAKLGGFLKHTCFKRPEFEFHITNAQNFLSYDETSERNSIWYGRIFGNGSAHVSGKPGEVFIGVNMATAPNSNFTFVLSDSEEANEYTFITFRDRNKLKIDTIIPQTPEDIAIDKVKKLEERIARDQQQANVPTKYAMDIQVEANQNAEMILIMDPIAGDRIKARGNGNLHMTYESENEDLFISGTYTLSQGKYNFTLQDIIIKDFTINEGSSISFNGDPYEAVLDIDAVYSLNANLSDLDESFLQDKDLNRTNVPVQAVIKVTDDMRQPNINFDLRFPTLKQDVYRKVKSIVSTEDMMSRQIIYLLALNRFYTPEYMSSTTKGNELVSVASSTISSQLSNILGELSENWSISPNFRSDKGDFSDVEVDLALSSRLLNNRLLFNGNFGYRDKSLNNNTFIGDFDVEYLLNKSGNIRLKAYNRYNDQNYYVKTALTTQGVGIVFKRDFDNIFNFLKPKKKVQLTEEQSDTITNSTDSISTTIVSPINNQ